MIIDDFYGINLMREDYCLSSHLSEFSFAELKILLYIASECNQAKMRGEEWFICSHAKLKEKTGVSNIRSITMALMRLGSGGCYHGEKIEGLNLILHETHSIMGNKKSVSRYKSAIVFI